MVNAHISKDEEIIIVELYFAKENSLSEVAKVVGRDSSAIAHYLKRKGYKLRTYGEAINISYKTGRRVKKLGENHPQWRGGRYVAEGGYIAVLIQPEDPFSSMAKKGRPLYVLEHRLVMARQLGRVLKRGELVHHLNGIRNDNRPENLGVVSHTSHEANTLVKLLRKRIRELEASRG